MNQQDTIHTGWRIYKQVYIVLTDKDDQDKCGENCVSRIVIVSLITTHNQNIVISCDELLPCYRNKRLVNIVSIVLSWSELPMQRE
jgi:hypothetical protein